MVISKFITLISSWTIKYTYISGSFARISRYTQFWATVRNDTSPDALAALPSITRSLGTVQIFSCLKSRVQVMPEISHHGSRHVQEWCHLQIMQLLLGLSEATIHAKVLLCSVAYTCWDMLNFPQTGISTGNPKHIPRNNHRERLAENQDKKTT